MGYWPICSALKRTDRVTADDRRRFGTVRSSNRAESVDQYWIASSALRRTGSGRCDVNKQVRPLEENLDQSKPPAPSPLPSCGRFVHCLTGHQGQRLTSTSDHKVSVTTPKIVTTFGRHPRAVSCRSSASTCAMPQTLSGCLSGTSFLVTLAVLCGLPLCWDVIIKTPGSRTQGRVWLPPAGNLVCGSPSFQHFLHTVNLKKNRENPRKNPEETLNEPETLRKL